MNLVKRALMQPANIARILEHPMNRDKKLAAFGRWFGWQWRAQRGGDVSVPFVNDLTVTGRARMTGAATTAYMGLNEPDDMGFVAHTLRPDDHLADVGGNIGLYSLLAVGVAGARATAYEPVAINGTYFQNNMKANGISDRVTLRRVAVGAEPGNLALAAATRDVSARLATSTETAGDIVPIVTLDADLAVRRPTVIKIDVEGFEGAVLAGARSCLASPSLWAVLLEINNNAERYGYSPADLWDLMVSLGFSAHRYDLCERRLIALDAVNYDGDNTLFLRRPDEARARALAAPPLRVLDRTF